jgi:hypothetical protein
MRSNIENPKKELKRDDLIKLAKDEADIRFDVENEIIEILQDQYNKEKTEGQSFLEWLDTKDKDYIRRIPLGMKDGGVISLDEYRKQKETPKIKKLNLDSVAPGKSISQLTDAERDVVKNLLRMTFENLSK